MFRYGRTPRTGDGKLRACGRGDLVPPLCAISVWRMFVSSLETQSICSLHRYRNLHIPPTTSYWIHCNARILSASNHSRPLSPRLTLFTKRQRQLPWGVANLHHNTDQLTSSGQQHEEEEEEEEEQLTENWLFLDPLGQNRLIADLYRLSTILQAGITIFPKHRPIFPPLVHSPILIQAFPHLSLGTFGFLPRLGIDSNRLTPPTRPAKVHVDVVGKHELRPKILIKRGRCARDDDIGSEFVNIHFRVPVEAGGDVGVGFSGHDEVLPNILKRDSFRGSHERLGENFAN